MLTPSDATTFDGFGRCLSIRGSFLIVGAFGQPVGAGAGAAYVYRLSPVSGWVETDRVVAIDSNAGDWFGRVVALDGDRVLIAASRDDEHGEATGSVYVFDLLACLCLADFDESGAVGIVDLLALLDAWGSNDPTFDIAPTAAPDGIVSIQDLLALLAAWGPCP